MLPHAALIKEAFRDKEPVKIITSRADWWESLTDEEKKRYLDGMHLSIEECFQMFDHKEVEDFTPRHDVYSPSTIKEECFGTFSNPSACDVRGTVIKEECFTSFSRKLEKK